MKRIKLIAVILIAFTTISYGATYILVSASYPINVNGQKLAVQPLNLNGTTYLPLRSVSEAVGVPIQWDGTKKSVEINTVDLDKLKAACVMIIASDGETYEQGSGVYIDYDQVLTAYHVIDDGRAQARTKVDQSDTNKMIVVSSAPAIDIALLKPAIEKKPVKIGDSDEVKAGDRVILVSSPNGNVNKVTTGTVKSNADEIVISDLSDTGSSGGGLFNAGGELIGIVYAGDKVLTESYAVPINAIRKAL